MGIVNLLKRKTVSRFASTWKRSAVFALLALSAPSLRAGVILSDSFTYPDGLVTNAPGSPWVTHSSTANEEVMVVSSRLQLTYARGDDVNALLSGQPYTTGGGATLYASFTVNFSALPSTSGSYFAHCKDNSTGYRARIWASTTGAPGGSFRLGIGNGTGATATTGQLTNDLALNTTYTVMAHVKDVDDTFRRLSQDEVQSVCKAGVAAD